MKKYIYAVIITCLGAILIGLNTKEHNPPVPEATTSHIEAVQEPIQPDPSLTPLEPAEPIVEAPSAPVEQPAVEQTVNQAQANVVLNPVGCANYRHLVEQYDWDVSIAMAVMQAESGCNPGAFNPEWHSNCQGSRGLFQIACVHRDSTFDPAGNVAAAYRIYGSSGWKPWGAYTSGAYRRYL